MRIGITGVTGYIGGNAAQHLQKGGHEVIGYSRSPKKDPLEGVAEMRQLITDPGAQEVTDFSGLDGLLHLAGEPIFGLWNKKKEKRVWSSRVDLTQTIKNQLSKAPEGERPKVVVSASGINYYGDRGDEWLTEEDGFPQGRLFPELVHAWEREALAMQSLGARVVCCRIGVVIGTGSPACSLLKRIFGSGLGGQIGDGRQWVAWISMTDLAKMFEQALTTESIQGPINCCAPEPARNSEMTKILGKALKRPTILPVPPFGLKLVFGPMSAALLDSVRAKPAKWQEAGFPFTHETLEPALTEAMA